MSLPTDINRFAIRVYALISNSEGQILLSEEEYKGTVFIKFPGGGLGYGESIPAGLCRELQEELSLNVDVENLHHIYTCDFLVVNQFNPQDQVIGVYYAVKLSGHDEAQINAVLNTEQLDGQMLHIGKQWINPKDIKNRLTFPMDQKAVDVYLEKFS